MQSVLAFCRPAALDKANDRAQVEIMPTADSSKESGSEDDLPPLHQNNNRQVIYRHDHDDSSSANED